VYVPHPETEENLINVGDILTVEELLRLEKDYGVSLVQVEIANDQEFLSVDQEFLPTDRSY
jgi:hypothetical protein